MHTSIMEDAMANGMSPDQFRNHGKKMVDYIANYVETIRERRVVPTVEPGYLRDLMPSEAPNSAESFETIMEDFERLIMPGVTHWQHPGFHAYFPAGNAFPSMLADMLSDSLGSIGFTWAACPSMTELEVVMLDWFGKMIGLPAELLPLTENGKGGGVIQSSASECTLVSLLAARFDKLKELAKREEEEGVLLSKLVAYCSTEAHSSVEKACRIGMVKLRKIETDGKHCMRGAELRSAMDRDREKGLIPLFVVATLGTTSCCSFDNLAEIGPVCRDNDVWLHVDSAYAGASFICPEFRYLMKGVEYVTSFNTNPHKWLLVNFDCSTMWVRDKEKLTQALVVDPFYLQHTWMENTTDFRNWGIPLGRRFRSLKLWFIIRTYGVEGLQKHIREHIRLAKKMEQLLETDDKFEVVNEVLMGLVCFRMKGPDERSQILLDRLNSSGRIHMVPAMVKGEFMIRFCVCSEKANDDDIEMAYQIISDYADRLLDEPTENNNVSTLLGTSTFSV